MGVHYTPITLATFKNPALLGLKNVNKNLLNSEFAKAKPEAISNQGLVIVNRIYTVDSVTKKTVYYSVKNPRN